jgi:cell division septation protein DedD
VERKYKNQKRTIVVLAVACVLLIALIIYFQVRIKNVKAQEIADYDAQVAELTQQLEEMQAAYDAKDYKGTIDSMKEEITALKDQKVELLATPTPEPTAEPTLEPTPTVAPTATPTVAPTATPTVKPTATPTAKPTATPTVKPTATPTVKPTATPTAKP